MIKRLKQLLGLHVEPQAPFKSHTNTTDATLQDIPRYPPFDRGLPLISVEQVIASQQDLIDRIAKTSGMTAESFAAKMLPAIQRLANYIHLLPATSKGHHRGAGGLFRLALEVGFYSLQAAQASTFSSRDSMEKRRALHPRWCLATFLAGLACEIYRPITSLVVVDQGGTKWPQLLQPLSDWAAERSINRYFILWHDSGVQQVHQANAAYLINSIIPANSLHYLNEENTEIVAAMTGCITGTFDSIYGNPISKIVNAARSRVIDRDIKANSERYGDFTVGAHLEPYLIDAMRRLIRKGSWTVNTRGAKVWTNHEGLFIAWQGAVKDIIALLSGEGIVGVPQDIDTVADVLLGAKVIDQAPNGSRYWEIYLPDSMLMLSAVKVGNPDILLPHDFTYPELAESLFLNSNSSGTTPAASQQDTVEIIPGMKLDMATGEILERVETPKAVELPEKADVPRVSLFDAVKGSSPEAQVEKLDTPDEIPEGETRQQASEQGENHDAQQSQTVVPGTTDANGVASEETDKPKAPTEPADQSLKVESKPELKVTPAQATAADLGVMADRLFGSIDQDASLYLKAILEDYLAKDSSGPVFSAMGGMAISDEELDSHGQASKDSLIRVLWARNWLWTDPEKPNRKLIPLQYKGKKVQAIVLKPEIARGMGFNWIKPKEDK